ncbi:multicopper oxidase domain-containing protein [Pedobacter hartonius]|uniref:Multicopper oxidase with three cupredoxin domains (Includes cell division protein FtsP and spore coat protein CotA) n=1 Tax=Pedobacter hartonius TaxID=425514 RepID=A0A1H4D0Z1_9SPHI|nr:multicopper oxidase domain-containing protein [Pedobacter hartonius]SEA66287.1 Multicopper oxidase with three cupredoxin domains (includes cell division protein FtsP and spore coat protein CotA) [Pedobacter hartonius]
MSIYNPKFLPTVILFFTFFVCSGQMLTNGKPKTVRYDLTIGHKMVNYTGKESMAMAINGTIPGPVLEFAEGDTAEIYVHNTLHEETSIHWHGLILPNRYDGVSYLTTQPIKAGDTHVFKFPLVQNGTYWYHSHTTMQEQMGLYGAFIIHKREAPVLKEYNMVISDWADMDAMEIDRRLHNASDWFAIKKNAVQSYAEAIRQGHFMTKVTNEWKRMAAMDVSDVAYDRFLINGKTLNEQPQFKAGEKVRLRIVNGGSSTYFWLTYGGGKMTVVANDGMDVVPVEVDRLIIAVAETYDVMVTIPENKRYEFRATAEDRTKFTSLWLGKGAEVDAPGLPGLKYFEGMKMMNGMMTLSGKMKMMEGMEMANQQMDMNNVMYPEITGDGKGKIPEGDITTLDYGMLKSPVKTTLPDGPVRSMNFELTGNMNRYVWSINNKTVSEADKILIKKGENVRVILTNHTMMRHPMHLHGHFFRVLNGNGDYSPLKNTLDIMPMETDTIEFAATESGDWFFHCHILYHMMSGMGRIFEYENSPPNPEVPDPRYALRQIYKDDRKFHATASAGLESNGSDGMAAVANTRWKINTLWHLGTSSSKGYESETMVGRYLGAMQWFMPYIGFDYHYRKTDEAEKNLFGQQSNKNNRKTVVAGLAYTLPMLVVADARIDGDGKYRFQLSREDIPVSKRLRANFMANTDREYALGLKYTLTRYFSLSSHYDSDMGWGGGLTLTY